MTIPAKVALLTNYIPPYRVALYQDLLQRIHNLQIYISTRMESNRPWPKHGYGLKYRLQKSLILEQKWRHPDGFEEPIYIHIPYDTLGLLKDCQPDIIISSELGLRSLQAALYCIFHPACHLILWCTLSEQTERGRGWMREVLRKWLLPRADAILVNGESGARYVRRFSVPDDCVFRIGQAPPIEEFAALPLDRPAHETIHLAAVGRLIELKGLLPFIDQLICWSKAHPDTKIKLSFAGEGPLREAIAGQNTPSNLVLQMLGNVNYPDMPKLYEDADILVFPTLADEWGLVVNEAMAAGLPVLGSLYSQAVEELVQDDVNGWTFFPNRPAEMERAIDRAFTTDRSHLAKMRISARARALTITPKTMADKIMQSIEYVLAKDN